jgi:hypothetical protein
VGGQGEGGAQVWGFAALGGLLGDGGGGSVMERALGYLCFWDWIREKRGFDSESV